MEHVDRREFNLEQHKVNRKTFRYHLLVKQLHESLSYIVIGPIWKLYHVRLVKLVFKHRIYIHSGHYYREYDPVREEANANLDRQLSLPVLAQLLARV